MCVTRHIFFHVSGEPLIQLSGNLVLALFNIVYLEYNILGDIRGVCAMVINFFITLIALILN